MGLAGVTLAILAGPVAVPMGSPMAVPAAGASSAQARLEADYAVTLAGLPIGSGGWAVEVVDSTYSIDVTAKTSSFVSAFASGTGGAAVRGFVLGLRLVPSDFHMNIATRSYRDEVRMGLTDGTVRNLSVEPPPQRARDHEPLTDAHKRAILDPFSAGILPASGNGGVGPEVCARTLAVFDGRQRFDLKLSFKRMEAVKADEGYVGPTVVCGVQYEPLGGFYHGRWATKFLRDSRDIEIWYAPIAGTPFVATYRASIPTTVGSAILQATRFVTTAPERRVENLGRPALPERVPAERPPAERTPKAR